MTSKPDASLLASLESMCLDIDGASLPFSRRLARENGWTRDYAERVVEEYKRFVYLAMTAGHPVTPSDEVDQAWHLHLTYTQHYWDVMCGEILGRPLHHGPTRGGAQENAKYHDWYSRTLAAYEEAFCERPPADVWPAPADRFAGVESFQRVNTQDFLLIPVRRAQAAAMASFALVLTGCTLAEDFGWREVLGILLVVFVLASIFRYVTRKARRRRGDSAGAGGAACGGGCGSHRGGGDDAGGSGCGSGCGGGCGGCGG